MELPKSEVFSVPVWRYAKLASGRYDKSAGAIIVPAIVFLGIAGMDDWRWWIIALMLLFLVFPMLATLGWFAIVGRPEMALLTRPQQWTFGGRGEILVRFYRFDREKDPEPVDSLSAEVAEISFGKKYDTVSLKQGSRFDVLLIPSGQLPEVFLNTFTELGTE